MSGIILNEDPSNYYMLRRDEENISGLEEMVGNYCQGGVKEIFFCPGARRAIYDSKVLDPLWRNVEFREDGKLFCYGREITSENHQRWIRHIKEFHDKGLDPLKILLEKSRAKGVSPWLSIRVNDCHNTPDPDNFGHNSFWREHPEMWLCSWRAPAHWGERALDFRFPEVRQQLTDFFAELLERYDTDGIELDWMRFGYHFRSGYESESRELLTELHRTFRTMAGKAAARLGHPVKIAARVPAHPEDAWGLGYDPVAWCREGLIDILTAAPFFTSTDTAIPIDLWRQMVGDKVILAAGIDVGMRVKSERQSLVDTTGSAMAQACSYFAKGADRLYLFNYFDRYKLGEKNPDLPEVLQYAHSASSAAPRRRRHAVTFADTHPAGVAPGNVLPRSLYPKDAAIFRLHIGKAPEKERASVVVLGFTEPAGENYTVFLNGRELSRAPLPEGPCHPLVKQLLAFDGSSALKDGDNLVDVVNNNSELCEIRWCEIQIPAAE